MMSEFFKSDTFQKTESIRLTTIVAGVEEPIDLAEPLIIDVFRDPEENDFILTNEDYHLLGVADTLQDAIQEIEYGLLFLRDEYMHEDDENLTAGGRELKSRVCRLFSCDEE